MKIRWYQLFQTDYYLKNFFIASFGCTLLASIASITGILIIPGNVRRKTNIITDPELVKSILALLIVFSFFFIVITITRIIKIHNIVKYKEYSKATYIPFEEWPTVIKYKYIFKNKEYEGFTRIMNTNLIREFKIGKIYNINREEIIQNINIIVNSKNPKSTYIAEIIENEEI